MLIRRSRAAALHLKRGIMNFVRGRVLGREFILPFTAVYHLNLRCNSQCSWCSREEDMRLHHSGGVDITKVETILRAVRRLTPSLYIAGGEPTLEANVSEVLKLARNLGFWPIVLNTNGTLLDRRPEVVQLADRIIVSLHADTPAKQAAILRVNPALGQKVFDNLLWAARTTGRVAVNCVLTQDNIEDAHGVLAFCLAHNIPFAVVPAVVGYQPAIATASPDRIEAYRQFVGKVMEAKSQWPRAVVGTMSYLQKVQSLDGFDCRPSGIITISPEGKIVNPCSFKYREVPQTIGVANGHESIEVQLRRQLDFSATHTKCPGGNCLKMCYVGPAMALETPAQSIREFLS